MSEPVFELRDRYEAESYWPAEYLAGALPVLEELGWLARPIAGEDRAVVERALADLWATDLDESDTFPFGLLWALRAVGAVAEVEGLDAQLRDWREWEETDHCEIALSFLPPLPEADHAG